MILLTGLIMVTVCSASPKIGQDYGGGIVFYLDGSGLHGLIASKSDIPGEVPWSDAKNACDNLEANGYSDWSLPDKDQLYQLYLQRNVVGGFLGNVYWSSTEINAGGAWGQDFACGCQDLGSKAENLRVRAVRAY